MPFAFEARIDEFVYCSGYIRLHVIEYLKGVTLKFSHLRRREGTVLSSLFVAIAVTVLQA